MSENKVYRAIGLMSGTSLDGEIDVALLETDGHGVVKPLGFYAHSYDEAVREKVLSCFGKREPDAQTQDAEALVTKIHIDAVKASGFEGEVVGFHGQTITHDVSASLSWQLGDGAAMAAALNVPVVNDFRKADIQAGGQGAPLAPLYHQAMMAEHDGPVCVINLGGVANVSYIGKTLMGFDCGPANALMDDYMRKTLFVAYDEGGAFAGAGKVDQDILSGIMARDFFAKPPPKSLDRNDFERVMQVLPHDPQNAMATLAEITVQGVVRAAEHFPEKPKAWYVCGGGRHNTHILKRLAECLGDVQAIEAAGFNGDAIEAECFGYLAVRSLLDLPLSLPETTGVASAQTGGVVHKA